jgi:histidinol-phosphate aminotransferase
MKRDAPRLFRDDVRSLPTYRVLESDGGLAMQRNEFPYELPDAVREEILDRVRRLSWRRYPELGDGALRADVRRRLALPPGLDVRLANGSNELIQAVLIACADAGTAVVIPQPTFSMYERTAILCHARPVPVLPRDDLQFRAEEILAAARASSARVVFLCRPNNPTGGSLPLSDLAWLAERVPSILVVDEAYHDFAEDDALAIAARCENVILLRTFSKALRAAGLRIGYAVGHPKVLDAVSKALPPYTLGLVAAEAVRVILAHRNDLEPERALVLRERARLRERLAELPSATVLPSETNFVCLQTTRGGAELTGRLAAHGLVVRDLSAYPGLENGVRVTVGTTEENDRLIDALNAILEER